MVIISNGDDDNEDDDNDEADDEDLEDEDDGILNILAQDVETAKESNSGIHTHRDSPRLVPSRTWAPTPIARATKMHQFLVSYRRLVCTGAVD